MAVKPKRGTIQVSVRWVGDDRSVDFKRLGTHPELDAEESRLHELFALTAEDIDDMLSNRGQYSVGANQLSVTMPASFTIQLDEPWERTVTPTGGSGNYAIRQLRLAHDFDLSSGVQESDFEVLGATDGVLFGNGNTRNHKLWLIEVTDTDSGERWPVNYATAPWMQLTIDGYDGAAVDPAPDPGDGGNDDTPVDPADPLLIASASYTGARTGPGNTYAAGDTITVTLKATNGRSEAPLTNVRVVEADGLPFGAATAALPAFGDEATWTATYTITAGDVTARSKQWAFALMSDETAPSEAATSLFVQAGERSSTIHWGWWAEERNLIAETADQGVTPALDVYNFVHTKVYALNSAKVDGNASDPAYVVNVINEARAKGATLQIQLGSSADYGWNFATTRGNFSQPRWLDSVARFGAADRPKETGAGTVPGDPAAAQAIIDGIADGTVRYIMLIDEPFHQRWSPTWNGEVGDKATGSRTHVSNAMIDEMAALCKELFGNNVQTAIRGPAINLAIARGGLYNFQHLTHAQLTLSPNRWPVTGNIGPNKGFEWAYTIKNNFFGVSELESFPLQNLKMVAFMQFGFESNGNPWTGSKNFAQHWWRGNVRYPYLDYGFTYVKAAPDEIDFMAKSILAPRDPVTGVLDPDGVRWTDDVHFFRYDRLPTDAGRLPINAFPHYVKFMNDWREDMENGDFTTRSGLPIGLDFDPVADQSWKQNAR